MLDWINQHSESLSVLGNLGLLAVWIFYAQLALSGILKQRRPRILINQIKGRDLDAEIIIANMSEQKIYIQLLLALISTEDEEYTHAITDVYIYDDDNPDQISQRSSTQGPLNAGGYMHLGSFRQVAARVARGSGEQPLWGFMELRLVFFYGSASSVVAAQRRFLFNESEEGRRYVYPDTMDTQLLYRMWHRRKIRHWLRNHG